MSELGDRVVVVSPHLDDAALSLGAAIHRATSAGASVMVLTVFAGDADSERPAAKWDRRCGFESQGEAARARRIEDQNACAVLGADAAWLPFADGPYADERDPGEVISAVRAAAGGMDTLLVPGFPLLHADHLWLARALLGDAWTSRVGLYVEQPYALRGARGQQPVLPPWLSGQAGTGSWTRLSAARRDRSAKLSAVRAYRSQLMAMGLEGRWLALRRHLWSERVAGGERLAWLDPGPR